MSDKPFPVPEDVRTIEPAALYERLRAGQRVGVLDTRPPEDVAAWRIDEWQRP